MGTASPEPLSDTDLETAASLVDQAGGRQWAITEADRHIDAALAVLKISGLDPASISDLEALANLITERDN